MDQCPHQPELPEQLLSNTLAMCSELSNNTPYMLTMIQVIKHLSCFMKYELCASCLAFTRLSGFCFQPVHNLTGKWAPQRDRTVFICCFAVFINNGCVIQWWMFIDLLWSSVKVKSLEIHMFLCVFSFCVNLWLFIAILWVTHYVNWEEFEC